MAGDVVLLIRRGIQFGEKKEERYIQELKIGGEKMLQNENRLKQPERRPMKEIEKKKLGKSKEER